jgi:hypothetical protein
MMNIHTHYLFIGKLLRLNTSVALGIAQLSTYMMLMNKDLMEFSLRFMFIGSKFPMIILFWRTHFPKF